MLVVLLMLVVMIMRVVMLMHCTVRLWSHLSSPTFSSDHPADTSSPLLTCLCPEPIGA